MRTVYNFEEIAKKQYLTFANHEIGFSIQYPKESSLKEYNHSTVKERFGGPNLENIAGALNISLVSQPQNIATELYDGLSVDVIYLKNINSFSLDGFVKKEEDISNNSRGMVKVDSKEQILINRIVGYKVIILGYGGKRTTYYFLTKNKYILEINILSVGVDKEKFGKVADEIIQSLHLLE